MDRNALDWLFSTAPQALAALAGLIFAGVAFIVGTIDKQMELDDSREDICRAMKLQIHVEMGQGGQVSVSRWHEDASRTA